MTRAFTGWHITAILCAGFGIVVAVNLLMASLAVGSFGGVVVENSYVASQKFNRWLADAERENVLGWSARASRDGEGHLLIEAKGVPAGTSAEAELRHPLGKTETLRLALVPQGGNRFVSDRPLPEGRWLVRLTLVHGEQAMHIERPVG